MGLTKNEILGREYVNDLGFNKQFNELNDEEMFEALRDQRATNDEYDRLHPLPEIKPLDVYIPQRQRAMTYEEIWEDKIRFNSH